MSETAEVTVTETPVSVTIIGDTPDITINDGTPQITIYDHSTSVTTTIAAAPEVTIEATTTVNLTVDQQPVVVVNTGAGTPYDESTLLSMLAGKLTFDELGTVLQGDITNDRDMWSRIGNEIVLLYQDGVDITTSSQTYTDTEIVSSVAEIHVTITGETDAKITVVEQTATVIDQRVTDLQIDTNGNFTVIQTQITQNATGITSTVTRLDSLDGPTGLVTQHTSQISQNDSAITLEITNRESLGTTVTEHHAEIVLNTTDIGLQVSQINTIANRMDTAETNISANSIVNSVNSTLLGTHEYSIEAVETLLANRWALNISEDAGGNEYSTGFQLMLHPVWLVNEAYVIDDTIFYNEKVYVCILGHTATTSNNPDGVDGATYWSEIVGGVHSEFVVEAEKFQVSIPTESSPVPVFTVSGSTVRINGTLITDSLEALTAYIEMSIQSTNYVEGVSGWRIDKNGDFDIYGGTATFGSGVLPNLPSDENLVGYWSLDEGSGAIVRDSSGEGNDGVIDGATFNTGISGTCLDFDYTVDNHVDIADFAGLDFGTGDFSISCLAKINAFNNQGSDFNCIVYRGALATGPSIQYGLCFSSNGQVQFLAGATANNAKYSQADLTDGLWHHIVGVRKSGVMSIYVDTIVGSETGTNTNNVSGSENLVFGGDTGSTRHLDGSTDEIRLYNKALTAQERQALFLNPGGLKAPLPGADITYDEQGTLQFSPSDNMITNPDFEIDMQGWVKTGSSGIYSIKTISDGVFGGKIFEAVNGTVTLATIKYIPVDPSKTYYGEIWVKVTAIDTVDGHTRMYAGITNYDYNKNPTTDDGSGGTRSVNSYFIGETTYRQVTVIDTEFVKLTGIITGTGSTTKTFAGDVKYARPMVLCNYQNTDGAEMQIAFMRFTEVNLDATEGAPDWEHASDTTKIDGGHVHADSEITIGNTTNGDYCLINAGDIDFYYWNGTSHLPYKSLKRVLSGVANNGDVVLLPGLFLESPSVIVSPNSLQTFESTFGASTDQSITCTATSLEEYDLDDEGGAAVEGTKSWRFTISALIVAAAGSSSESPARITESNTVTTPGGSTYIYTSETGATYTTPGLCTKITVSGTVIAEFTKVSATYYHGLKIQLYLVVDGVGEWIVKESEVEGSNLDYKYISRDFSNWSKILTAGVYDYSFRIRIGVYTTYSQSVDTWKRATNLSVSYEQSGGSSSAAGSLNWIAIGM